MLCWFLPYINMNPPQVYTRPLPPTPPLHPHSRLSTEHRVELLVLYSGFPLATYFAYSNVCFHAAFSIPPTLSSPHCVHKSVFCVCVFTATWPCKEVESNGFIARYVHTAAFLEVPTLLWSNPTDRELTYGHRGGWGGRRRRWGYVERVRKHTHYQM